MVEPLGTLFICWDAKNVPTNTLGKVRGVQKIDFWNIKVMLQKKNCTKATDLHFNEKGHSVSDKEMTILEKVFNCNPQFRKQREKMWINKFNTRYIGLNQNNGG